MIGDTYNEENFSPTVFQNRIERYLAAGFDAFSGYNYRKILPMVIDGQQSYAVLYTTMTARHENCWSAFAIYTSVRYAPCILGGWDNRPRETELAGVSCYKINHNGNDFAKHIENAHRWIQNNPNSALDNLAFINAWGEIDEGGYIIPTKGAGFEMPEGLKSAVDKINGDQYMI